ncbi:DNA translocase FtsK [Desulfobacca acetoxidans]|uniref:Cell division protein FtsK/SpoIIIE n=1 Tax=Desulfobacca acetoxidans (strain ATCC 700848 / DSM 11109 / ASRB2) TaxID=880072 RepID=F2NG81_DESAR|nr:DNA translocase FtsK [Desulfobacca acetoxidans]AEB08494.1 cell division protein FtsK/SpoIIIE [Desulfobacca acetoxidans DSM 11109]
MPTNKKVKKKAVAVSRRPAPPIAPPPVRRLGQELGALVLLVLDAFLILSLASYNPADPQTLAALGKAAAVANWAGKAGALLSAWLMGAIGLAAFWLPIMVSWLALQCYQRTAGVLSPWTVVAYLALPLTSAGLLALGWPVLNWGSGLLWGGGAMGRWLTDLSQPVLNLAGTVLVLTAASLAAFMGVTRLSYVAVLRRLAGVLGNLARSRPSAPHSEGEREPVIERQRSLSKVTALEINHSVKQEAAPPIASAGPASPVLETPPASTPEPAPAPGGPEKSGKRTQKAKMPPISNFQLPPVDFLSPPPPYDQQVQEEALLAQARKLENTLMHFGVEGKVVAIRPGPVITMIEFEPALGVKISKVTGLADDLALALKALSIRIVAPVPGKAVIGIEVPNPKRQLVTLREVLSHEIYHKSPSRLTIALGKDITGQSVVADLAKMPHLLIAGATGTGKSVGLNAMIISILYKATPEEVRFLMVDPKRIELSTYEGIPHLLHPVVTNPKVATTSLRWAVEEMERRYGLLSDMEVRNIENYNQKLIKEQQVYTDDEDEPKLRLLPYIVIIIDELADLMLVSSRETEEYLIRLAQKSRAAGIHLILATQRPSVDVITGLIKANFPTRISFQVSSKVDSRTILDTIGAERLLGMGDMLFIPPGTSRLKRIHGAFVSEDEVKRVVEYLKTQQAPVFEVGILEMQEEEAKEEEMGDKDEKYADAIEIVAETRQASISMLQRRLRIGYNRAARIIEMMEKEGLVGPSDGIKAREVYVPRR